MRGCAAVNAIADTREVDLSQLTSANEGKHCQLWALPREPPASSLEAGAAKTEALEPGEKTMPGADVKWRNEGQPSCCKQHCERASA